MPHHHSANHRAKTKPAEVFTSAGFWNYPNKFGCLTGNAPQWQACKPVACVWLAGSKAYPT
jgi:hypothetical protein